MGSYVAYFTMMPVKRHGNRCDDWYLSRTSFSIAYNGPNPAIDAIFHPKILFFAIFSTYQVRLLATTHRIIVGWLIIT